MEIFIDEKLKNINLYSFSNLNLNNLDEARHLYTNVPLVSTESAFNLLVNQYKRSVYSVEDSSSVPTDADAKNSFKVSTLLKNTLV